MPTEVQYKHWVDMSLVSDHNTKPNIRYAAPASVGELVFPYRVVCWGPVEPYRLVIRIYPCSRRMGLCPKRLNLGKLKSFSIQAVNIPA